MKHRHKNRILGRVSAERKRLMRSLSVELLKHGSLVTTEAKAKELRIFFEPLVTKAKKKASLHQRRQLLQVLPKGSVETLVQVADRHALRPGGYLRITRVLKSRQDASRMMRVEILNQTVS